MGIAIHVVPYFKTVNWIHAAGRVGERYIRKGNKIETKTSGELDLYSPNISVLQRGLEKKKSTKYKMKSVLFLSSFFTFFLFGSPSLQ